MSSLVRNFLTGLVIMGLATLVGIVQNSMRNQPMALIPQVHAGPGSGADSTAADSSGTGIALGEGFASLEQLHQALNDPATFIIDARADKAFAEGHIAGAINIPYDRFTDYYDFLLATVPLEAMIICYCWSPTCDFSDQLAQELRFMGYQNVHIFREGWEAWQEAGYASEP